LFVLQVTRGPDTGKKLRLEPGRSYTVGCNDDASLVLADPLVLKGHCSLEVTDASVILRNHTASAGTFVGEQKVSQATLKPNTAFRIGGTTLLLTPAPAAKPAPRPSAPDPLIGKILGGYKLNQLVGEGGMGKVYKATQLSLHRDVALKVLRDQMAKDKSFRDLFINEARAAAQLIHPNIVQVYDAGNEGDVVFFSMEFLGQGSVEEILEKEKKIPWERAILLILEAAHGLEYAESKGIVHRDIKPDNLMLNEDGRVKIADLGLAKRAEGPEDQGIIGTPHFIPPEQALGKEVDHRADIYSLGATFFRMITGRTLFSGKSAREIVLKHIKEPPPAASSVDETVPGDLDLIFAKMLAKEPEKRYQSATDLIAAIEEVCAHHGIKGAIIKKGVGKRVLIPLVALLLVAGGAVSYLATRPKEVVSDPEQIAARQRAEREAREAEEKASAAARDTRKEQAERKLLRLEKDRGDLRSDVPLSTLYDNPATAPKLEMAWTDLKKEFEDFARSPLALEFDSELEVARKAQQRADEIGEDLRKWRESTTDRKEKKDEKLRQAKEIDGAQRRQLADLRARREYERAANLCYLIGAGKPGKENPFGPITDWVWVSPIDSQIRLPGLDFPEIKAVVEDAQRYFREEEPLIIGTAKTEADAILEEARKLGDDAADDAIQAAIGKLAVVRGFGVEAGRRVQDIQERVTLARNEQTRLENLIRTRAARVMGADRLVVRDKQRELSTLDPLQLPNLVMNCDFQGAIDQWNTMLVTGKVKTDLYKRFVAERVAMLRWCEYLFARFHGDLARTATGTEKVLRTLAVDRVPFPERDIADQTLSAQGAEQYKFALLKPVNRETVFPYARFPMDWVYNSIFLHQNEPRWESSTAETEFALGAFCFETMQYEGAVRHFGNVLKFEEDAVLDRYGAAARSFRTRAELERDARKAWEKLCEEAERGDLATLTAIGNAVQTYAQEHEGTLFHLDVMDKKDEPQKDFFGADHPEVPLPPATPQPEK
jgi:hypothetical protein